MKIQFKKISTIHQNGAVCYLLIFEEKYKIMLDCGINHDFDFSKYKEYADEIKDVRLILISHSAPQYSGAYPFLVSELGISPKIVYTTQPIMRYSPLNLHQEILNQRLPNYNKKIFNRIYSNYEEMNLVKPFQRKQIQFNFSQEKQCDRKIQFCCYLAGGYLGSVYWRISYGLVNILYLVEYNNYSMQHIGGLDLQNLKTQATNLLITDVYQPDQPKRQKLYVELKEIIINFYRNNHLDHTKPKTFNPDHDNKLLISCSPNELVVQVIVAIRKIVAQLQEGNNIQKIGVVHLSSRFLQLVKSQSQYFSNEFKLMLEKLDDYFEQFFCQSKTQTEAQAQKCFKNYPQTKPLGLKNRINICSTHSTRGILATAANSNVQVYRVGQEYKMPTDKQAIANNLQSMRIFDEEQRLLKSASKLSQNKIQIQENENQREMMDIEQSDGIKQQVKQQNSNDLMSDASAQQQKKLKSKYISAIAGIPRFIVNNRETDEEITEFGLRHHCQETSQPARRTIYDYLQQQNYQNFQENMQSRKQSRIEVMNILFSIPSESYPLETGKLIMSNIHKTQYLSSLRIIQLIRPKDIILINLSPSSKLFANYQKDIEHIFNSLPQGKRATVYDSHSRRPNIFLSYKNQLMEHKMNYLPELQQKKVQRVRGTIYKEGNCLHIHLDCLQDKEIAHFHLQKFYVNMRGKMKCKFVGAGIEIEGIKLYRIQNQIILEGDYSEQYFKVRKQLYQFLQIR